MGNLSSRWWFLIIKASETKPIHVVELTSIIAVVAIAVVVAVSITIAIAVVATVAIAVTGIVVIVSIIHGIMVIVITFIIHKKIVSIFEIWDMKITINISIIYNIRKHSNSKYEFTLHTNKMWNCYGNRYCHSFHTKSNHFHFLCKKNKYYNKPTGSRKNIKLPSLRILEVAQTMFLPLEWRCRRSPVHS